MSCYVNKDLSTDVHILVLVLLPPPSPLLDVASMPPSVYLVVLSNIIYIGCCYCWYYMILGRLQDRQEFEIFGSHLFGPSVYFSVVW